MTNSNKSNTLKTFTCGDCKNLWGSECLDSGVKGVSPDWEWTIGVEECGSEFDLREGTFDLEKP